MIDQLEVKGLDLSSDNEDIDDGFFYNNVGFHQEQLKNEFESLGVFMSNSIISIIWEYCKPGKTYIHTADDGWFAINLKALRLSKLLCMQAEGNPYEAVYVTKCTRDIMSLVAEYLIHHNGKEPAKIRKPVRSNHMHEIVEDPWDAEFTNKMSKREIVEVISAANYIDCQCLLDLGCAKIATLITGKSTEEMRQILNIEDDFEIEQNNEPVQNQPEPVQNWPEPLTLDDIEAPIEDDESNGELELN